MEKSIGIKIVTKNINITYIHHILDVRVVKVSITTASRQFQKIEKETKFCLFLNYGFCFFLYFL